MSLSVSVFKILELNSIGFENRKWFRKRKNELSKKEK
jgi:hypothetical protein